MSDHIIWRAPVPGLPSGTSPALAELAYAAIAGVNEAWGNHTRAELSAELKMGADGTVTSVMDDIVESRIVDAARRVEVNVLSEEIGHLDSGHAVTAVIDPVDGTANATSGVPLSCFSAALVDARGTVTEALNVWLENGAVVWAKQGEPVSYRTSGRTSLQGAAVDMLRPKTHAGGDSTAAWVRVADACSRVRVLSSSCLESMLVAQGAIDAFCDPGSDTHRIVDLAAALLFVPAAGGAVIDARGRAFTFEPDLSLRWSGIVAASRPLAEEIGEVVLG